MYITCAHLITGKNGWVRLQEPDNPVYLFENRKYEYFWFYKKQLYLNPYDLEEKEK